MTNPFIAAIDFDGVIAQYDGWKGDDHFEPPKPGAKEAIDILRAHGIKIVIWTCRTNETALREYLQKYNIQYDAINVDVHPGILAEDDPNRRKIVADVYLDDRGLRFTEWGPAVEQILDLMATGVK